MAVITATTGVQLSDASCKAVSSGLAFNIVERIAEIEAALRAVVRDVNDYEETNKLSPNPGRTECWDSVAHAKTVLQTTQIETPG